MTSSGGYTGPTLDIGAIGMPEHHASDGKGMAQVVQARRIVRATIDPTETVT